MSEIGRPHPAVERYVSKAVSPNERIEALEAEVERLTNKLNEDSQNFQIECQKAEIAMVRADLELMRVERDEARARTPDPDDLRDIIEMAEAWVEAGHPHVSGAWVRIARVRSTLPRPMEDGRE